MARRAWTAVAGGLLALAACATQPGELNLRESFVAQIAEVDGVTDVERDGDEVTFSRPDGRGGTASWRVHIDSAALEPGPNEQTPFLGHVLSSWFRDGERIEPLRSMSGLPEAILDTGIAQDCYALWDTTPQAWGW